MEAVSTSETSVDNHFTQQYIPEDNCQHQIVLYSVYVMSDVGRLVGDHLLLLMDFGSYVLILMNVYVIIFVIVR
jgi:hypothetical protein